MNESLRVVGSHPDRVVHRARRNAGKVSDADPVTTEVIRHGLNSAADQMKRTLMRTAFSPVIYEVLDFAVALYDRDVRLLAQAPSLPLFMGRLSFSVEAAVEAVGGEDALEPGDIVLYNVPYGTGSHPQDAALVMPAFVDGGLVGYAAVKGHWLDIGGKEPYSTNTVDVFQEGTIFPGVKLYSGGELVQDILRMAVANSRVPRMVAGDIAAETASVRVGTRELTRVIERHGAAAFWKSVERMFDHGEAVVRDFFEKIPDGRYVGRGVMDDNGLDDERLPFEIVVEVSGSEVVVDYSNAPDAQPGPVNCPFPKTVAASRVAIATLAGAGEATNEGHFRPLTVVARRGSLFHPLHPAPTFIGGWPALQAIEAVYGALAQALPEAVPACSGGDICSLVWWGRREATGEPWADGSPHPVGQGAHARGDGASSVMHVSEAATRIAPVEVWEARNPWLVERFELASDSCGPGRHRGGLGVDIAVRLLEDAWLTPVIERTTTPPWGLAGGGEARSNGGTLRSPDGALTPVAKATRLPVPRGAVFELSTGGGGGYGPPSERDPAAVARDLADGYISPEHAYRHYAHALPGDRHDLRRRRSGSRRGSNALHCNLGLTLTLTLGDDVAVRRPGFGALRLTGPDGWGEPADREGAKAVLRRAVALGVTFIDTADSYGPWLNEQLIAESLRPYPDDLVIATKGGLRRDGPSTERWPADGRPEHLKAACVGSLQRLKLDCIDLYQLHAVDPKVPLEESLGALAELQTEGKIRYIGVSNVTVAELARARKLVRVVSVQNGYSLADLTSDDVLHVCERDGLVFIPWYPLALGALARPVGVLARIAAGRGATPAQVALAWLLRRSRQMLPIPGTASIEHLEENVAASRLTLTAEEVATLGAERT